MLEVQPQAQLWITRIPLYFNSSIMYIMNLIKVARQRKLLNLLINVN